jgi:multiple sugar transport system substrate-binding protein
MPLPRRAIRWFALGMAATLGLTACGGSDDDEGSTDASATVSQAEIDKAMQTPTELTFWTWLPDIQKEVDLFQRKYPAIKVNVVNVGQGQPHYQKLRTALKAGSGAPDVVQLEFPYIPSFTITNDLLDLRPYGAGALKDRFVDFPWGQVTGQDGQVWAIPQDTGPMGMLYRQDIFDKHGITPPKTWAEFADAARKLHAADPNVYLTNMAANGSGFWLGLAWQAGAKPFEYSGGKEIGVSVNDEASQKLADYWGGLVKDGVVSTDPDFTDQWYQGLNQGKYATWLTAAWGPVFLSASAKDTSGKWRAAPLPQWNAGENKAGNWGGSTSAVIKTTKNPIAAAKFAEFLNTDAESTMMLATQQFLFPPTKSTLNNPTFVGQKPEFYGGQQVNEIFAQISGTVSTEFQWPPFLDQVVKDWDETVGKSFADKSDTGVALDQWQERVTSYAKSQGFTVK